MSDSLFGDLWEDIEDPITIVLRKRIGDGEYQDYSVENVRQRQADEMEVDDFLPGTTKVFHMWKEMLDNADKGLQPKREDIIVENPYTADEVSYTIFRRGVHNQGQRFRCVARENVGEDLL